MRPVSSAHDDTQSKIASTGSLNSPLPLPLPLPLPWPLHMSLPLPLSHPQKKRSAGCSESCDSSPASLGSSAALKTALSVGGTLAKSQTEPK